jgi:hypothetical protein
MVAPRAGLARSTEHEAGGVDDARQSGGQWQPAALSSWGPGGST